MPYTEFTCDPVIGSNLNSGSTTSGSAAYTAINGGWDSTTGVFTPASGDPSATVAVGDFASIYNDGATSGVFVGRVTAVSSTTITVSLTAKMGNAPTTNATARSCKVGGAWQGPNALIPFPFGGTTFLTGALCNAAGDELRVTLKNNGSYAMTATIASGTMTGPLTIQGCTTTPGDGGRAVISTASNIGITLTGSLVTLCDVQFSSTAATGTNGVQIALGQSIVRRVIANGWRGIGLYFQSTGIAVECEAYDNNKSNSSGMAGIHTGNYRLIRCISHDNTGSNAPGFFTNSNTLQNTVLEDCISESNGSHGMVWSGGTSVYVGCIRGCDFYNNAGSGISITPPAAGACLYVENCNFIKNAAYGIVGATNARMGLIKKCGFGAGTQANTLGTTSGLGGILEEDSVTYANDVTPYVDPANGNFNITLAAAKGAGRGTFLQTAPSYSGTVGYPDIGAAQHLDSPGIISKGTNIFMLESEKE